MKFQKILLVITGIVALACIALTGLKYMNSRQMIVVYQDQQSQIDAKAEEIASLQQALTQFTEVSTDDLEAEVASLQDQIAALNNDTASLTEEAANVQTSIDEKNQQYEEVKDNAEYYESVWASLREGYQKVLDALDEH